MDDTAEVRWILDGPLPHRVSDWFGGDASAVVEERSDRYVVLPGCETVGIKLRGSEKGGSAILDVKAMRGHEVLTALAAEVSGRAAGWTKWTVDLPDAHDLQRFVPASSLTTHKRRRLRRFTSRDGRIVEVPTLGDVRTGCDVELTTIGVDELDGSWWTLGFEAFGPRATVWDTLRTVGEAWFERHGSPPPEAGHRLDAVSSRSYPAWSSALVDPG